MQDLVAVITPLGVALGHAAVTQQRLLEEGFLIVDKQQCVLSHDQARLLARSSTNSSFSEATLHSAPSVLLHLRRAHGFKAMARISEQLEHVYTSRDSYVALRDINALFEQFPQQERTLLVLQPGCTPDARETTEAALHANHFIVLASSARTLSSEEASALTTDEAQVAQLTSGPSQLYVLERLGAVDALNILAGPEDVDVAVRLEPDTLRAQLALASEGNQLHTSASFERATQEIAALFPEPFELQRTLAVLGPKVPRDVALRAFEHAEFTVLAEQRIFLSHARAEELVFAPVRADKPLGKRVDARIEDSDDEENDTNQELVEHLSSGPVLAFVLCKPAAVETWKRLSHNVAASVDDAEAQGAAAAAAAAAGDNQGSMPRTSSTQSMAESSANLATMSASTVSLAEDVVHAPYMYASSSPNRAARDIRFLFPALEADRVPTRQELDNFMSAPGPNPQGDSLHHVLVDALAAVCRAKPVGLDAIRYLGNYLLDHNPNKPRVSQPDPSSSADSSSAVTQFFDPAGVLDNLDAPVQVVFTMAAPGSEAEQQYLRVQEQLGFETVPVSHVLSSGEGMSEYADIIRTSQAQGRPVPANVVVELLGKTMLRSGRRKFLVSNFPRSLDEALEFEKQLCAPAMVLLFDCQDEVASERLARSSNMDSSKVQSQSQRFWDRTMPLVEHYKQFRKLHMVECNDDADTVFASTVEPLFA